MRLLRRSGKDHFILTKEVDGGDIPRYAILSHTWLEDNDQEVTFHDLTSGNPRSKPKGFAKLQFCGEQAAKDGLEYFWVDTCCINKESSSELQEAMISMFAWYSRADRCYAYLSDVSEAFDPTASQAVSMRDWEPQFRRSKWFTRGWTLQELLAPKFVEFFSHQGTKLGDKTSLETVIHDITGIPVEALRGADLRRFSVEERLSWAEHRQTKRREDKAYCLLGIFNVFMTLMYGEKDSAFVRLRKKIDKNNRGREDWEYFLAKLPWVQGAAYNALQSQHQPTCLPNTRTELLRDIRTWIYGDDRSYIFWLNGKAGTGKSTVARTVARYHQKHYGVAGSFFFSKGGGDLSKTTRLATALARQLVDQIPEVMHHVCKAIKDREDILEQPLEDQWKLLITGPLKKLPDHWRSSPILFVIDALDECDNKNDVLSLLHTLNTVNTLTNVRLRIFITSRPEAAVQHGFQDIPQPERASFVLHEISRQLINRDLSLFFEHQLAMLRTSSGFDEDWPGSHRIEQLVQTSSELFIWAATACRFISKPGQPTVIIRRLDRLLGGLPAVERLEKGLDQIYTAVLQDYIEQPGHGLGREEMETYALLSRVMGSVLVLRSPLPIEPLSKLVREESGDLKGCLEDLDTIFQVPREDSYPVQLHHPTFRDFLLNKERCLDRRFWVDAAQAHKNLGDHCISLMSEKLRMNICGLASSSGSVESLTPQQIRRFVPLELEYACLYWVEHYSRSGLNLSDEDPVSAFFQEHFLHWLEVMSIIGKSNEQGGILRLYHSLLGGRDNKRQIPFVIDARKLMSNCQNLIKQTPLQVYYVARTFFSSTSEPKLPFPKQMDVGLEDVASIQENARNAKEDFNYVSDLAFTLDSTRIAAGSNYEAVRCWDVTTRARSRKYQGRATEKISAIAISPDGKLLAGGSDDSILTTWDIETGEQLYSVEAHKSWINSVAFSPDGKLLASGSMDKTIAIREAKTGKETKRFDNQSTPINSATFSPNSSIVATGSVDELVRLWDISEDSEELVMTLNGHSGPVNSVRFSPHGKRLASGSDDMTIAICDTTTGAVCMMLKGHTDKVSAVCFSANGRTLASGSADQTVRLWHASTGAALHVLEGHASGINSVSFSPNDSRLASSSFDDEVRLWDTSRITEPSFAGRLDNFDEDTDPRKARPRGRSIGESLS